MSGLKVTTDKTCVDKILHALSFADTATLIELLVAERDALRMDVSRHQWALERQRLDLFAQSKKDCAAAALDALDFKGTPSLEGQVERLSYELASLLDNGLFDGSLSEENFVSNNRKTLDRISRSALRAIAQNPNQAISEVK